MVSACPPRYEDDFAAILPRLLPLLGRDAQSISGAAHDARYDRIGGTPGGFIRDRNSDWLSERRTRKRRGD